MLVAGLSCPGIWSISVNKKSPLLVVRCLLVRRCFKQIAADHGQLATDRGLEDNPDKPELKIED
jgi:hypothetical protein